MFRFRSVKAQLMTFVSLFTVLMVSAFLYGSYEDKWTQLLQGKRVTLEARYQQVQEEILSASMRAYSLAEWVANMPEVQQAFA
jgi:hypothetical protein